MIVPKVYRSNKACVLLYLNDLFDIEKLEENFDVNSAIIYNPCFEELELVLEKLRNQGLEIRLVVDKNSFDCLEDLKDEDFDILEVQEFDSKIKKKLTEIQNKGKRVEIYLKEMDPDKMDVMLWNLKEFNQVYVPEKMKGKIKKQDNVRYL